MFSFLHIECEEEEEPARRGPRPDHQNIKTAHSLAFLLQCELARCPVSDTTWEYQYQDIKISGYQDIKYRISVERIVRCPMTDDGE